MTAQAQSRVIVNPDYEEEEGARMFPVKVELSDTATTLHILMKCNFSGWGLTNTYLEATGKRYTLKSGLRIPTLIGKEIKGDTLIATRDKAGEQGTWLIKGPEPFVEGKMYLNPGQADSIVLHFEPLPADVSVFDCGDNFRKISLVKTKKNEMLHDSHLLVMPDAAPEQFMEAIVAQFPGKVVFIDLWATWCGPCKRGISKMGPVKKELKDQDAVFIYLTDESSPEDEWRSSIASMAGYHLRMSSRFWDKLPCIVETNSIPQYLLYDRQGKQILHQIGFADGAEQHFKNEILKASNE